MILRFITATIFFSAFVAAAIGAELHLKPSRNIIKKTGDNFMIQCKIKDDGSTTDASHLNVTKPPTWTFVGSDGTERQFTSGRNQVKFIDLFTTNLLITNAAISDAGTYRCSAEVNGVQLSKESVVTLYKSIELVDPQPLQHPTEGTTAKILCKATADPAPEINWFKKQKTTDEGEETEVVIDSVNFPRYSIEDDGQTLIINNFDTALDNGFYKCSINQVESGDMKDLSITVTGYVSPQIKHVTENSEFNESSSGELSCAASGVPTPEFRWYKDNRLLTAGEEYGFPEPGLLKILKTTPEDAGSYKCEAFNTIGNTSANLVVKIFLLPKIVSIVNVTAKKEESVEIPCAYSGGEPLKPKWISKQGDVTTIEQPSGTEGGDEAAVDPAASEHNRYAKVDNDRKIITLHIKKAMVEDSGEYQCEVSNKAGTTVQPAVVKIEHQPMLIERSPKDVRAIDASTVELFCAVDALPLARWTWTGPNGFITSSEDLTISNSEDQKKSSLRISQASGNYGSYKCVAENDHGLADWTMEVLKIDAPPLPEVEFEGKFPVRAHLIIKNYAKEVVPVIGSADDQQQQQQPIAENKRPTKIEVKYVTSDLYSSDMSWEDVTPMDYDFVASGKYDLYKLKPKTQYTIAVKGVNEAGPSDVAIYNYETSEPEAPIAPVFITTNMSDCLTASCTVQWAAPEDGGSSIVRYIVMYMITKWPVDENQMPGSETGDFDQSKIAAENLALSSMVADQVAASGLWLKEYVDAQAQQIELKNLLPKTAYKVRVQAENGIGESQPSPDLYIKTREFGVQDVMTGSVNAGAIVAIVIIVVLIFVLLVDVACYYVNQCGLLMCVCVNCCGKTPPEVKAKEMDVEHGKSGSDDKKPLQDVDDVKIEHGEDTPMIIKDKAPESTNLKKDTPV